MTLADKNKTLDDKIKTNQTQYDLGREVANISALLSKELEKYYYLTSNDLKYTPGVVEQTNFKYSPLGKILNKGLGENDKKGEILKRLGNI